MARRKEKAACANAGEQAARAMQQSHADTLIKAGIEPVGTRGPNERADDWWYHEAQAVRMARIACYHAFKARPELKPLDSYEQAVADHRNQQHGTMAVKL